MHVLGLVKERLVPGKAPASQVLELTGKRSDLVLGPYEEGLRDIT